MGEIDFELITQYRTIQVSGVTNMLDSQRVHEIANFMGYDKLADLAESVKDYSKLISAIRVEWLGIKPYKDDIAEIRSFINP